MFADVGQDSDENIALDFLGWYWKVFLVAVIRSGFDLVPDGVFRCGL